MCKGKRERGGGEECLAGSSAVLLEVGVCTAWVVADNSPNKHPLFIKMPRPYLRTLQLVSEVKESKTAGKGCR